jgi:hypothetical protein
MLELPQPIPWLTKDLCDLLFLELIRTSEAPLAKKLWTRHVSLSNTAGFSAESTMGNNSSLQATKAR